MRTRDVLFVALMALFMGGCGKGEPESFKVGVLAPLTGDSANYGRSTKQGVDLAVAEINKSKLLQKPLVVVFEDDRMNPKDGVNALTKLIDADKVPVVLGPFGSSVVLACAPVAEKTRTVIISASATADGIADAGDYVFRITPPNSRQGKDVADFSISKLHAKTGAIIFQNNDYGITLRDAFQKRFTELGGKVLAVEAVESGATDFRAQLSKIKQVQPDVVFFPEHYRESAGTLKQAKELGIQSKFISADGAMTEDLLKIAGNAAEGTYYSTLALGYGISDNLVADFTSKFKQANNGQEPDIYAAYYYEVTKIIAEAIKNGGYDADKIKAYLYSMNGSKSYRGITGITSFDAKGEVDKPFYIYEVKGGKFVLTNLK